MARIDFKERNAGHVINLGSVAGREPYQGGSIYCATKHAVRSFGTSLMKELYDTPIRVSEVQPGESTRISIFYLTEDPHAYYQAWLRPNSPSFASVGTSLQRTKFTRVSILVSGVLNYLRASNTYKNEIM